MHLLFKECGMLLREQGQSALCWTVKKKTDLLLNPLQDYSKGWRIRLEWEDNRIHNGSQIQNSLDQPTDIRLHVSGPKRQQCQLLNHHGFVTLLSHWNHKHQHVWSGFHVVNRHNAEHNWKAKEAMIHSLQNHFQTDKQGKEIIDQRNLSDPLLRQDDY